MYSMNDSSQRRAVVFQVLKEIISHEECMQAMWILENSYNKLAVVPILEYVDCIELHVSNLGVKKLYLSRELIKILYSPVSDVYDDPWEDMQKYQMNAENSTDVDRKVAK